MLLSKSISLEVIKNVIINLCLVYSTSNAFQVILGQQTMYGDL